MAKTKPPEEVTYIDPPESFLYLLPPKGKLSDITRADFKNYQADENGNRRLRLSPTKLVTFDQCPANFRAQMIGEERDGGTIYTSIGTAAHHVLELLNKGQKMTPDERSREFKNKLIQICADSLEEDPNGGIALSYPKGYSDSNVTIREYETPFGMRVFSAEKKQVLRFSAFDISYIADVILEDTNDGTIEIRDYKTNASVPKSTLQLDYYAACTLKRHPELAERRIRACYHMLRTGKVVYKDYEPGYLEKLWDILESEVALMGKLFRLDLFDTNPSADACQWCTLKPKCPDVYERGNEDAGFIKKAFNR